MGLGDWDMGLGTQGCGDWGMRRRGEVGTWGRQDSGTCGDLRTWDIGTGGRDKQTTPEFCAEFVKYNSQQ